MVDVNIISLEEKVCKMLAIDNFLKRKGKDWFAMTFDYFKKPS